MLTESPAELPAETWEAPEKMWKDKDWEGIAEWETAFWADGQGQSPARAPEVRRRVHEWVLANYLAEKEEGEPQPLDPPAVGRLGELRAPLLEVSEVFARCAYGPTGRLQVAGELTDEQERRLLDDYRAAQALTTFTSQQSAIEADERYGPVPRTTRNASMKLNMRLEACALRMDSSRLYARRRGRTIRLRRSTSVDGLKLTVEKQEKLRALAARAVMAVRETARVGERTVAKAVDARREAAELRRVAKRPATPLWIVEERKRPKGPTALPQTDDEKRQEIENVKSVEAQQSQDLFTMWKKAAGLDPDVEPDDSPYEIQDDSDETILIEEEDDSLQCAQRVESELDISCEEDMIPDTPPDEDYLESVRAEMLEEELLVAEWLEARDALKREAEKLKRQEDVVRDARRRVAELEAKVKRMDAARSEKRDYDPLDEIEAALRG